MPGGGMMRPKMMMPGGGMMRPVKKFQNGGVPQGDPNAGSAAGAAGASIAKAFAAGMAAGEDALLEDFATEGELDQMKYLNMLIDSSTQDKDYTAMDTQAGRRRSQRDLYDELNNIISNIETRMQGGERQERLSKGNPKPGPYEFAAGGKMDYKVAKSLMNPMMEKGGMTKDEKKEAREKRRKENKAIRENERFQRRAARDRKAFTFGTKRKGVEALLENLANPEKAYEKQQIRKQLGRMVALGLIGGLTPNIARQINQRGKFVPQNETSSLLERILPGLFTED